MPSYKVENLETELSEEQRNIAVIDTDPKNHLNFYSNPVSMS